MGVIRISTIIEAPQERCFDLSRNVNLHVESAAGTEEKIVSSSSSDLLELGDVVTFEGRHFGIRQCISAKISQFNRPHQFRDSQVSGIFKRFDHDHLFESAGKKTIMKDVFDFECPFGFLGLFADSLVARHLEKFLKVRAVVIKEIAEGDRWKEFLQDVPNP